MQIRDIGRIRKYLSQQCTEQLVHSFITTRLDYCNCLLYGAAKHHLNHLQLIQNTAARIITRTKQECHIRPVLKSLHWLPIDFRIIFKILLITFKAINGLAPSYISDWIKPYSPGDGILMYTILFFFCFPLDKAEFWPSFQDISMIKTSLSSC